MYSRASGLPFAVYAYAASVLSHTTAHEGGDFRMKRDDAARMVRALLDAHGAGPGAGVFKGGGRLGVMLGRAEIFFAYDEDRGALRCDALVYRFRREPRAGVLEGLFDEEARGGADTGGGALDYRADSRALVLGRDYLKPAPPDEFAADVKRLAAASLVWADEVLGRVAEASNEGRESPAGGRAQGKTDSSTSD